MTSKYSQPVSVVVFLKSLAAYVLFKLLLTWDVSRTVLKHHMLPQHDSWIVLLLAAPAQLASVHPDIFFICSLILTLVILLRPPAYITNVLFFWLCTNLFIISIPIGDGSDIVLVMLSFWSVAMVPGNDYPLTREKAIAKVLFNLGRLFCQLQIVFIYAASGVDKAMSKEWRSGEAFNYLRHLEGAYNQSFPMFFQNPFWDLTLGWIAILFELAFGILIWFQRLRPAEVLLAVIFHLIIWWMINLSDFSIIMIVALLLFVDDRLYHRLFRPWLLSA